MKYYGNTISNGMIVLSKAVTLDAGVTHDFVLHTIKEPFWNKVIDATEKDCICFVETPGVGQTTRTPILMC
jgi:hypothetical protein